MLFRSVVCFWLLLRHPYILRGWRELLHLFFFSCLKSLQKCLTYAGFCVILCLSLRKTRILRNGSYAYFLPVFRAFFHFFARLYMPPYFAFLAFSPAGFKCFSEF